MAKQLVCVAGLSASVCAGALGQGPKEPQLLENAIEVSPIFIARATCTGGNVHQVGNWIAYHKGDYDRPPAFDCYGDEDWDGVPDDTSPCGVGLARWYFGTGYCNGFVSNDMRGVEGSDFEGYGRADFAWYWTCAGFGTEQCVIGVFTEDADAGACEPDSFDHSGWLLNFGTLSCNPGYYYYTNADISSVGAWPAVTGGDGSYVLFFLTSSGASLATCAQPMLWGTGDAGGTPFGPGTQGPLQLDDDNPLDGSHTTSECYDYAFGVCPDPLGPMMQFWGGFQCDTCHLVNCDDNNLIDTRDVLCFLAHWTAGDDAADFDWNGAIDTRDVIGFLSKWSSCVEHAATGAPC